MNTLKFFIALFFASFLAACNTVEGMGEDVEAAGDKIEREAEDKKNY